MCRVLIVDDYAGFRATARAVLEADGMTVVGEAADGASALEAASALAPELVLLDVQLPDMTGFEVAAHLRAGPAPPDVILTSSRTEEEYEPLAAASGARGFIPKDRLSGEALAALLGA